MRLNSERLTGKGFVADILCPCICRHSEIAETLNGQVIIASGYPEIAFFSPGGSIGILDQPVLDSR